MKKPAMILAVLFVTVGFIVMLGGVITHRQALTGHLVPLVGGVMVVMGQCIRMWALTESTERQAVYAKATAISMGCILGLTYIINGAELVKF